MANASTVLYRCQNSKCLNPDVGRALLTVKKVVFLEMGPGGRTVRSRVTAWLCPVCTAEDNDWNREKFAPLVGAGSEPVRG